MEKMGWGRTFLLKNRGIAAVMLLFVSTAVIGICGMYYTLLESARVLGRDLAHSFVQDEELNISRFGNQVSLGLVYLEEMNASNVSDAEKEKWVRDFFRKMRETLPEAGVEAYAILDGRLLAENPWEGMEDYDFTGSEWYQEAVEAKGAVIYTDAYYGQKEGWVVSAAAIDPESGDGIILDLSRETFQEFHENQSLPEGGAYYLCDANGRLLYSNTHFQVTEEQLETFAAELYRRVESGEVTEKKNDILGVSGEKRGVYFSYVNNGWFCAMTMTYAALLQGMKSLFGWYIAVLILFFLTAFLMGYKNRQLLLAVKKEREIVQSLGNSYYAFYRVNVRRNTYEIIKGSEYINARAPVHGEYTKLLHMLAGIMDEESGIEFLKSFSLDRVRELIEQQTEGFGGDFLRRFDDEYRWVNVSLLADKILGDDEGVICFRKIHEEKQHQKEYQKLLEDVLATAEMSEKSQRQFFTSMSHEMKTPLNIIIGMADMALRPDAGKEKITDCLNKIKLTAKQLAGLINDILEKSRLNQKGAEKDLQVFDLKEVVLECMEDFSVQAEQEDKEFAVEMDIKNREVTGKPLYLIQVLNHLLSNALKFTHTGDRITVKICQAGEGDKLSYRFTVEDTGIGMPKEFLPRLFEPYATVKRFEKQKSGKGLGLAIVKNLVMQMDGVIHAESELGKGSRFIVTIPFITKETGEKRKEESFKKENPEKGEISKENPEKEYLKKGNLKKEDLNKENFNKENFNKENLNKENLNKEKPKKENLKKENFSKEGPGEKEDIKAESIEAHGEREEESVVPEGKGQEDEKENELKGYRILVAEDNPLNMEIAVELLHMAGAEVDTAVNGQEAVELFEKSATGYYDAVVLDMQMPVLDGCGAAEAIRGMNRPDASVVPIAALTANTLAEDMARTAHAGMNVHMAKPVMAEKLWDTLYELIQESRRG